VVYLYLKLQLISIEMEPQIIEIKEERKVLRVTNACIDNSIFDDISAKNIKILNANLSDLEIEDAQLGGAYIHNIGMPPKGHPAYDPHAKQRPLKFEDCDLTTSTISNCNLSGVAIDKAISKG